MSNLPVEIMDEIMTTAVSTLLPPSLSSIALVAVRYRILVNKSRFSSISLGSKAQDVDEQYCKRLNSLADLIKGGFSVKIKPPVASFIVSFSLYVRGDTNNLRPLLHNGSLAYIFGVLFRQSPDTPYSPRSKFRRVSLDILNWDYRMPNFDSDTSSEASINGEEQEEQEETFLNFSLADSALTVSFVDFLLNSQITHLHISHIHNIPLNFLLGSKLHHLSLGDVSFSEPDESDINRSTRGITLHSVVIGGMAWVSFEIFGRLISNEPFPPPSSFNTMTKLTLGLGSPRQMEILKELLTVTVHLEDLCLNFVSTSSNGNKTTYMPRSIIEVVFLVQKECIDYTHLSQLRTIEIQTFDCGASFPFVTKLLGRRIPPSLSTIKISNNELHESDSLSMISRSLQLYPFDILDNHFEHSGFRNITMVIFFSVRINDRYNPITFDADAYRKEYYSYVANNELAEILR
ncbi:hypothetical protein JR316_0010312 [Psilocybe cubensis]|uniref:Uncharacterized protein n=1 Tax=Psilocybe cubensis TaxID=181762 RepID=A0ACB8GQR2_PSICU|nr:hypothetical protein JR316_0010312 [Psilocybe cubensis]KAH9478075.1 hypothetical protein JR316_0010312 [Psilocybe cubensis]